MSKHANTIKAVGLLLDLAKLGAVFRDVHLRRDRDSLTYTLDEFAYRAIRSTATEIEDQMRLNRTVGIATRSGKSRRIVGLPCQRRLGDRSEESPGRTQAHPGWRDVAAQSARQAVHEDHVEAGLCLLCRIATLFLPIAL
jgi:hypothetical protein